MFSTGPLQKFCVFPLKAITLSDNKANNPIVKMTFVLNMFSTKLLYVILNKKTKHHRNVFKADTIILSQGII
jgi:hypothetical protein